MLYRDFFRFFEAKDHLINKLDLTPEQKEQLIQFFKKHPNYEGKIDWNRKDLKWDDFQELLSLEGTSRNSIKKYGKSGKAQIEDLEEGRDYNILYEDDDITCYEVLTFKGSEVLAKPSTAPEGVTGGWCIAGRNYSPGTGDQHWKRYTSEGKRFVFLFTRKEKWALCLSEQKNHNADYSARQYNYKLIAERMQVGKFSRPGIFTAHGDVADLLTPEQFQTNTVAPKVQVFDSEDHEVQYGWDGLAEDIIESSKWLDFRVCTETLREIKNIIDKKFGTLVDIDSNPKNARVKVDQTLALIYIRPDGKQTLIAPPRKAIDTWVIPEGVTCSNMVLTENDKLRDFPRLAEYYSQSNIPAIPHIIMPSTLTTCEWSEFFHLFRRNLKTLQLNTLDSDQAETRVPSWTDFELCLRTSEDEYMFGDWEVLDKNGKVCDLGLRESAKQIITTPDKEVFEVIERFDTSEHRKEVQVRDKYGCVYYVKAFKYRPGKPGWQNPVYEERTTWYYDPDPIPIDKCIESLKKGSTDITFILSDIPKTIMEFVAPKYLTRIMCGFTNLPNLKRVVFPDYSKEAPEIFISATDMLQILDCLQLEYVDFANPSFGYIKEKFIQGCPKLKTIKFGPYFCGALGGPILFDCLNVETMDFSYYKFEENSEGAGGKRLNLDFLGLRSDRELTVILPKIPDGCQILFHNSKMSWEVDKYKTKWPKVVGPSKGRTNFYPFYAPTRIVYPGTLAEFSAKVDGNGLMPEPFLISKLLMNTPTDGGPGVKELVCKDKTVTLPISPAEYLDYQIIGQKYKMEHGLELTGAPILKDPNGHRMFRSSGLN